MGRSWSKRVNLSENSVMSHFTKIKTQIAQKEFLLRALKDLGHSYEEGEVKIRGYAGASTAVEVRIPTNSSGYDIGFSKNGDTYEVVADWYGVRGFNRKSFLERLAQRYAYHATKAKLEEQGFAVSAEETQNDGRIHLVLRRIA